MALRVTAKSRRPMTTIGHHRGLVNGRDTWDSSINIRNLADYQDTRFHHCALANIFSRCRRNRSVPFFIGRKASFPTTETPVYAAGVVICMVITPLDYACLFFIEHIGAHAFIGLTRTLGTPFVVISSAWFDRDSWPSFLKAWKDAHDAVKPDWERPIRRFSDLTRWLLRDKVTQKRDRPLH